MMSVTWYRTAPRAAVRACRNVVSMAACALAPWLSSSLGAAESGQPKKQIDYTEAVAVVRDTKITRSDLAEALIRVHGHRALDVLVKRALIRQEAKSLGIKITSKQIDDGIKQRMEDIFQTEMHDAGFQDEEGFSRFLAGRKMTIDSFRAQIRAGISPDIRGETEAVLMALKLIDASITISEEEVKAEFDDVYGPRIHASQIVVRTRREAEEVRRKLASGADFGRLARVHSIDRRTAVDNGKMKGPIKPLDKQLWRPVASLKKGGVSSAVRTRHGWHLLKVDDIKGRQDIKFEEVRGQLVKAIRERKGRDYLKTWYVNLLEKADVRKMLEAPTQPAIRLRSGKE